MKLVVVPARSALAPVEALPSIHGLHPTIGNGNGVRGAAKVSFHRRSQELHGGQSAQHGDDSVSERPSHGGERLQQDDEVSTFCDLPPLPPEPGGFKALILIGICF